MLLHQLVDVHVLALLNLVDLLLAAQLQVIAQHLHLLLVLLLQLLCLQLKLLAQLGDLLAVLQLQRPGHVLVCQFLLFQLNLEAALVGVQRALVAPELILLQLQCELAVGLERRDVVLVLVQEVLYFLLVDLNLHLMALLHLLHLPVLVAQLGAPVVQLLLGNLPERIDFVTLQLHVIAVLLLLVLLLFQSCNLLVELLHGRSLNVSRRGRILLLLLLGACGLLLRRHGGEGGPRRDYLCRGTPCVER
mmetsp:Transcript_15607/g.46034  ORF Transcript_15607/g.46034 Transcript_15607/m.46034 type:complete len:248 (-) Transcript_15607:65-808(-)